MQKNLITYSFISFIIISFFGFNFLISLLGNILIILILTPILLIGLAFLGINFFKSKINICDNCGAAIVSDSNNCLYCGFNLNKDDNKNLSNEACQETIEIDAEEIK
tara:strand:- start:6034 stop:6354 length:321 start_codon:yes stop_codon:yes gene_type:complete